MPNKNTADRRLYWNADRTRIVEHGDADAAFLAVPEGREVPDDVKAALKPANKAQSAPAEDKSADTADDTTCPECGFVAKTPAGLAAHERSHTDDEG